MNQQVQYPNNSLVTLLNTNDITEVTKTVLRQRLLQNQYPPAFFNEIEFRLLSCICGLLTAQENTPTIHDAAIDIDKRLANNKSDGWRYDMMPADKLAYRNGLRGIADFSLEKFSNPFEQLREAEQLTILQLLQNGTIEGAIWENLPAKLFFEELLAETTFFFYSHPLVLQQIGFVGMADANGWQKIGLNEKDAIEVNEINSNK